MTDARLNDRFDQLMHFISLTVSQSEARLEAKLTTRIDSLEFRLERKMDDGFAGIADIITSQNDRIYKTENRLSALEQRVM